MALAQWGKVYFQDIYAGTLAEEPGGRFAFQYDESYLQGKHPAIAFTLPLQERPHHNEAGLHPFFDNLTAEGWLKSAQARALGVKHNNRFALLLGFGQDCIGAVSIVDPEPKPIGTLEIDDPDILAALASKISLSGVQPKIGLVKDKNGFRPAVRDEVSTYIAKLPSSTIPNIVENELLTLRAVKALLPNDTIVEAQIHPIEGLQKSALVVKRFDRLESGERLHFEEFNQLLGKYSEDKYEGAYEEMGQFILHTPGCIPAEAERLFRRILTCVLTGNTDAHFKNFAMFHTEAGLRLTPAYDLVSAAIYPEFNTMALSMGRAKDLLIGKIDPKHLVLMAEDFNLGPGAIRLAVEDIGKRLSVAQEAVFETPDISATLKDKVIKMMEKRWNGTFSLIGKHLSKKQSDGAKSKSFLKGD